MIGGLLSHCHYEFATNPVITFSFTLPSIIVQECEEWARVPLELFSFPTVNVLAAYATETDLREMGKWTCTGCNRAQDTHTRSREFSPPP